MACRTSTERFAYSDESAALMSSQRSSTSSIPMLNRTKPGTTPAATRTSSGTNIWLELNGHSMRDSTPPRLVASKMMFKFSHEGKRCFVASFDHERHHARAFWHGALGDLVVRVAGQGGVVHPFNGGIGFRVALRSLLHSHKFVASGHQAYACLAQASSMRACQGFHQSAPCV